MAITKNAAKDAAVATPDKAVADESAKIDAAIRARHSAKIALIEGDSERAAELNVVATGGLDTNPAADTDADTENKNGDA